MSRTSLEGKKINLIPFPDGSLHNHPNTSGADEDPESLRSRLDSFLNGTKETETPESNVVYKDFSDVPKPTNLELEPEEKHIPTAVELAMKATDKYVEKNKTEEVGHFVVPEGLVSYIDELVAKGRPLKYLQLDLKESIKDSNRWKKTLGDYRERAVLDEEEYEKAVSFLNKSSSEGDIPSAVDIAMEVTDRYVQKKEDKDEVEVGVETKTEKAPEVKVPTEEKVADATESMDKMVEDARQVYVKEYIDWKNKHRAKKSTFQKLLSDLGVEKQLPESEEPESLVEARNNWAKARTDKAIKDGLFDKAEIRQREVYGGVLGLHEYKYEVNTAVAEYTREEYDRMYSEIKDSLPKLEKGIAGKAMEKWTKLSRVQKVAISTTIMTAGGVFGGMGLAAAGTYAGYRFSKSLATSLGGSMVGQAVGKSFDGVFKKNNEKNKAEMLENYSMLVDEESLVKRDRDFARAIEREKNTEKKQRLIKAAATATAAGGFMVGTEAFGSVGDNTESIAPIKPVEVELSSKGFIQDVQNLKAEIIGQYGGVENVPESIKANILDKNSVELTKELGLYDPVNDTSGLGFKGETLGVDSKGNIVLERLTGETEVLFDSEKSKISPFQGEMINRNLLTDEDMENLPETSEAPNLNDKITNDLPELGESPTLVAPEKTVPVVEADMSKMVTAEAPLQYGFVNVVEKDGIESLMYRNGSDSIEIANNRSGLLVLDDKFQNGEQYRDIRSAFTKAFEESNLEAHLGTTPIAIPFENGKIHIIAGTEEMAGGVKVLLNGKEIANGPLGKVKLVDGPGIKSGWFFGDTVYERAFKQAQTILKTLKNNK